MRHWFGVTPFELRTPPEEGGLTFAELGVYLDGLAECPPPGCMFMVTRAE